MLCDLDLFGEKKKSFFFFFFFFFLMLQQRTFLCSPFIPQCVYHPVQHQHLFLFLEDVAVAC